jgi:mannose/fructose-specific phosphotransferase system component IIA
MDSKGLRINGLNLMMLIQIFFHRVASANLISHMIIDGQEVNDFSQIQSYVVQFYKDLFGKGGVTWGYFL